MRNGLVVNFNYEQDGQSRQVTGTTNSTGNFYINTDSVSPGISGYVSFSIYGYFGKSDSIIITEQSIFDCNVNATGPSFENYT